MSQPYWADFQQSRSEQRVRPSPALCGNHVLTMVSHRVDPETAKSLTPRGATPPAPGADGKCQVLYTFSYQQFVRYAWVPAIVSVSYLECIVGVPGVMAPGGGGLLGPFSSMGKLYVNSLTAMILGRLLGYPKVWSTMSTGAAAYRVSRGGSPVLSASFEPAGAIVNPFEDPGYREFQAFSHIPAITRTPLGNYLCSVLEFDRAVALAQPVTARIQVHSDLPGLAPGEHIFQGTADNPLAAMRARIPWSMTLCGPAHAAPEKAALQAGRGGGGR